MNPCLACRLFCMSVPARHTPLIDATSGPIEIIMMFYILTERKKNYPGGEIVFKPK